MVIEESEQLSDRYRLEDIIGSGGMGTVFRARDEVLDRTVAVKLLKESLASDESAVDRFKREARIAASLTHPAIAQVFDFGQEDGRPFIVMEFLEGEDLHSIVARNGPLDPIEAAAIGVKVADALEHAHAAGTIHRDVKPGNIFRTATGDIKLTDFGIARLASQTTVTSSGSVLGTYHYLSPEVVNGDRATQSADIYSLGCVLYELLSGGPPYTGDTPLTVAMAHVSKPVPDVRSVNPSIPVAIASVVSKAMAKERADRFTSAAAMAKALRDATAMVDTAPSETSIPKSGLDTVVEPVTREEDTPPVPEFVSPVTATEIAPPMSATEIAPERRVRRSPATTVGAVLVAIALILIAVLIGSLFLRSRASAKLVVANFTDQSYAKAAVAAKNAGLEPVRLFQTSPEPEGRVVSQDPAAGRAVAKGTQIRLVVSDGQGVAVPGTLVGMSQEGAENALRNLGLVPIADGPDVDNDAAVVVDVGPPAGTIVRKSDQVTIFMEAAEEEQGKGKGKGKGKQD